MPPSEAPGGIGWQNAVIAAKRTEPSGWDASTSICTAPLAPANLAYRAAVGGTTPGGNTWPMVSHCAGAVVAPGFCRLKPTRSPVLLGCGTAGGMTRAAAAL